MEPWIRTLLSFLFISGTYVWATSEDITVNHVTNNCCDPEKYRQLQDRLDILETSVRNIVSAIASQKKGPLASISAILERDPAVNAVLWPKNNAGPRISKESTLFLGEAKQYELEGNATTQLKRALKCSLAHLLDVNTSETSPSGKMKAVLNENNSLEIEWTPPSMDCLKVSSGIWVRVSESGNQQPNMSTTEAYVTIPQKCLKRRANTSYSFILHASSSGVNVEKRCHFQLKDDLIPCQVYNVEVVPNYQSLKGRPLSTDILVPPTRGNSTSTESLIGVTSHPDSLALTWRDNSGCASQLTALSLKIFPDGDMDADAKLPIEIPRSCFEHVANETNSFSIHLSSNHSCPVKWDPLDACRRYKLEIQSVYWDARTKANVWRGASTMWETFTTEQSYRTVVTSATCNKDQFHCDGNCYENSWICDGTADCTSGIDELHCDTDCYDGFQCGAQCVPHEQVCNGEYDCLDGSDEMNSGCEQMIEYSSMCYQIRNGSGHLSSQVTSPNDVNSIRIHSNRETHWSKSVFLILVQSDHQIWLSFNKFLTPEYHSLKVYDGPYSNSPLILSHSGATRPPSIRSSSNHLYLEIPSFHHQSYGVEVFYTSMPSTVEPFVPGCGGYVYRDGVIAFPDFLLLDAKITECVWFVEAGQSNRATALKKSFLLSNGTKLTSNEAASRMDLPYVMIVSDGWNSSGEVLHDSRIASAAQGRSVTYSISHKTTVRILRPENQTNKDQDSWNLSLNVSTMHMPEYAVVNMTAGSSGTIKSPYFPVLPYEGNSDYRWNIHADSNSTIRLLFAFFDTQAGSDYVYVYDGPTMNSSLILEKSGTVSVPFTVTSSTNQILIRFVSDDDFTLHSGFLALYSPV